VGPQRVERHVVLTEVRAGRPGGQRHVHAIVDDHGHRERPHERAGEGGDLGGGHALGADLDDRRATLHRPLAHRDGVASLEQRGIGDHHETQ
jgi:hypothetical protein